MAFVVVVVVVMVVYGDGSSGHVKGDGCGGE